MRDVHEFQVERADLELVASLDLDERRVDAVFLALGLNEGEGELGTDQRNVRAELEQVRHATDVVFVAVGEHERLDLVETVLDVVEVRQDEVHARLLLFREEHAAVDEQDMPVVFDHVHVAADLTQTAERHDAHGALAVLRRGDQHFVLLRRGGLRRGMRRATVRAVAATGSTGAAVARATVATAAGGGLGLLDGGLLGLRGLGGLGCLDCGFSALGSLAAALVCCCLCGFFCSHFLVGFLLLIVSAYAETRNLGACRRSCATGQSHHAIRFTAVPRRACPFPHARAPLRPGRRSADAFPWNRGLRAP